MNISDAITATAAIGPAAFAMVDAAKAFWGGPSNFGFGFIKECLQPFQAALAIGQAPQGQKNVAFLEILRANWLNGVPLAEQKAKTKSLIHLGLTPAAAPGLAAATGLNPTALTALAQKIADGVELTPTDVSLFGRFDTVVAAQIDTGFERADQRYRNAAKAIAAVVAAVMGVAGAAQLGASPLDGLLVGLAATPLAPVAKDLSSTLAAAVTAVSSVKR